MLKGVVWLIKIGFDLDGTIADIELALLHLVENNEAAEKDYYRDRTQIFNPYLFLHEEDEGVIITSRKYGLKGITEEWLRARNIRLPIVHEVCPHKPPDWENIAKWKAEIIKNNDLDIYIDDNPTIVTILRKECPKCKVIQYGARRSGL